ncbi:hypothetical protein SDC9_44218 [bioreactor metagenome]|uniref:Uncharacterized protein n=1 Tax=bioreactor metagenome TaxID=1076179 RepID=A0A644W3J7_9ZZZZ
MRLTPSLRPVVMRAGRGQATRKPCSDRPSYGWGGTGFAAAQGAASFGGVGFSVAGVQGASPCSTFCGWGFASGPAK